MKRPAVQGEAAQQVPVATGRGSASVRAVASAAAGSGRDGRRKTRTTLAPPMTRRRKRHAERKNVRRIDYVAKTPFSKWRQQGERGKLEKPRDS